MRKKSLALLPLLLTLLLTAALGACGEDPPEGPPEGGIEGGLQFWYNAADDTYSVGSDLETCGEHVVIPATYNDRAVTTIAQHGFSVSSVVDIVIPESVTSIEANALDIPTLKSVTFSGESSLQSIGENAFLRSGLTAIEIPKSVTSISPSAFAYCESLETVTFEKERVESDDGEAEEVCQLQFIDEFAFEHSAVTEIEIPKSVSRMGEGVFLGCALETITFEKGSQLQTIGAHAFRECYHLKEIAIPENVTAIGIEAFESCSSLRSVKFPASLTSIGKEAFISCTALKSAEFEEPLGWSVTTRADGQDATPLDSQLLGTPATAAGALLEYYDHYWQRG